MLKDQEIDDIVKANRERPCCHSLGEGSVEDENGVWCHCKKPSELQDGTCGDCAWVEESASLLAKDLKEANATIERIDGMVEEACEIMRLAGVKHSGNFVERIRWICNDREWTISCLRATMDSQARLADEIKELRAKLK